ncbi:MAG: ABC transporter substrate-binding protein [Calditrichaeota bacterium]|nr:ABC transporter substrate-binding protein [Calditrichota bacterium]
MQKTHFYANPGLSTRMILSIILAVSFIFPLSASRAESVETQALFNEGVINYKNGNFDQAKLKFMTLASAPKPNPRITISYLMLAKTYIRLGDYRDAENYAANIIRDYPTSRYRADAHFIVAVSEYHFGDAKEAVKNFALAVEFSQSTDFANKCELYASRIVQQEISSSKLQQVYNSYPWDRAKPLFTLLLVRAYYADGKKEEGDALISEFLASHPQHRFASVARRLRDTPLDAFSTKVRVGIVLPMTGLYSSEANNMLRGMAYALKKRQRSIPKIELLLHDSQGTMPGAIRTTISLLNQDITLLIGELEGNESAAVAGLSAQAKTPLIVPVATENGIASIGNTIFQANNDLETRGNKLAEYAFQNLGLRTFAIFAPADNYGHALADAFSNRVDELGGTIIAQQWYYPGTQDFKHQFNAIREAGFRYAFRDSLIAHGLKVTPGRIDSLFHAIDRATIRGTEEHEGLIKTNDIPINSIDGMFLPIYEEDLDFVAPQLALANINAQLLGGSYWQNDDVLRKQRRYVNGVVFVSGNYISETDYSYKIFVNDFRMVTSASPTIMSVYGYNVMSLLIKAIDAGNAHSDEIVKYLENVRDYQGIGEKITMGKNKHVNSAVNFLKFEDGNIIQLQDK